MALNLCFWNKECIRKRQEEQARQQALLQQQQQLLYNVYNSPTGGLKTWHIVSIIGAALLISAFVIYKINKRKNK